MRKILIIIGIAIAVIIVIQPAMAQKIDQEKMQRDLEVAETVLQSLLQNSRGFVLNNNRSGNAQYIEGYGVVLNIPQVFSGSVMSFNSKPSTSTVRGVNIDELREMEIELSEMNEQLALAGARGGNSTEARVDRRQKVDSLRQKSEERQLEIMKTFLLDYADLIGQLKDTERIKITAQSNMTMMVEWPFVETSGMKRNPLSAEIKKSDLTSFKSGKISKEEASKRIVVTSPGTEQPLAQDLELLSSIFGRLYSSTLSKTYYQEGKVFYERMNDYGVIYNMNVYSSNNLGKDKYYMPTTGERDLSEADRNKRVKELYPQFEKDLKEHLVDYGRTVKSLKDDESLVFKIKITKCDGCSIPSTVEASIKALVLKEYNTGKLDKSQALAKIVIKKGPDQ